MIGIITILLELSILFKCMEAYKILNCQTSDCNKNGIFNNSNCSCKCKSPFIGLDCICKIRICQNAGEFNSNTCKCDCFKTYNGDLCEIGPVCENEHDYCNSFDKSNCSMDPIEFYCPVLCGLCSNETLIVRYTNIQPKQSCTQMSLLSNFFIIYVVRFFL